MDQTVEWLLDGDISIQFLTHKLLMKSGPEILNSLQKKIETQGYGQRYLSCRGESGHWGIWFYQPKWTCTHYTLTDLKEIGMPQSCAACKEMVMRAFSERQLENGGINFAKSMVCPDICVNGMFLNYACYFTGDERNQKLAEFILSSGMPDGGYTWDVKARKSDPHTTVSVLEGFHSYKKAGFKLHLKEIGEAEERAKKYLYENGLFLADDPAYRRLSYPYRYRYDVLRALEYFASEGESYDVRLQPVLDWLKSKRKPDGYWHLENSYKGNVHFDMEQKAKPSRFITLKALYILKAFGQY